MADVQRLLDHDDRVKEAVSHSHESFRDARIRAAFAIAPVLGPVMTKASLAGVKVPVRIIVGSKDDQASPDVNARPIASAIPNAEIEIIPNVTHYTFLARCNLWGKVVARSLCADPDEIDREEVHRRGQRRRSQILQPHTAKITGGNIAVAILQEVIGEIRAWVASLAFTNMTSSQGSTSGSRTHSRDTEARGLL